MSREEARREAIAYLAMLVVCLLLVGGGSFFYAQWAFGG